MYKLLVKRLLDLLLSGTLLIILCPILIISSILLYIQNKGKVLFVQERPGMNGEPFKLIKFKTMHDGLDSNGKILPDKDRITKLGRFMRDLSLDELPQLINVFLGKMSLIGPRPLLFKYMPLYNNEQIRRHKVKPGITGWAQVNGRNNISWSQKFDYDVFYVDNISLLLDIKIFWLTLIKIIKREGTDLPSGPFNGSN